VRERERERENVASSKRADRQKTWIHICSTLQHSATQCNSTYMQLTAKHGNTLRHAATPCVAVFCSVLQYFAVCCSVLHCVALCCSVLSSLISNPPLPSSPPIYAPARIMRCNNEVQQQGATKCIDTLTLQHTATYFDILQHNEVQR